MEFSSEGHRLYANVISKTTSHFVFTLWRMFTEVVSVLGCVKSVECLSTACTSKRRHTNQSADICKGDRSAVNKADFQGQGHPTYEISM